jgi:response regulator RpfG family c-di-GMP phosphodiesterase
MAAVNEGQIFRLLVKPCASDALGKAVDAAAEQHRLITAERVLLEQTVHGCIKALTDLLAIVQPASFGRATRLKRLVETLAVELDVPDRWQVEVAALLSQVGYIVVPSQVAERVHRGQRLTRAEQELVARLPRVAEQLIASIPRMDGVREILVHQQAPFVPASDPAGAPDTSGVPIGSRLLRLAVDFDELEARGLPARLALDSLEGRARAYDPAVLAALRRVCGVEQQAVLVEALAVELDLPDRWQVEIAALLSQVGYIVVPPEVAERVHRGQRLTRAEQELVARLPRVAEQLIASIPRMDGVRAILLHQQAPFVPASDPAGAPDTSGVPIGSRLLRLAVDFDELEARGMPARLALDTLEGRARAYDPAVLAALRRVCGVEQQAVLVEEMRLADVRPGMIFAADVVGMNGLLLVARGQEVTPSLIERIRNSWYDFATKMQVNVITGMPSIPTPASDVAATEAPSVTRTPSPTPTLRRTP